MEMKNPNKEIPLHPIPFSQNNNSSTSPPPQPQEEKIPTLDPNSHSQGPSPSLSPSPSPRSDPKKEMIRYRECQRNHAAHLGSHVVDGCGEFMPSGEEGTHLALKCAACNCHRNFHRRELEGQIIPPTPTPPTTNSTAAPLLQLPVPASAPHNTSTTNCYISFSKYHKNHLPIITPNHHHNNNTINDNTFAATTPAPAAAPHGRRATPVMMAFGGGAAESSSDDLNGYRGQFVEQYGVSKKRFRTKFTQEQKDKMMEFAEKLGWKIQKQDDVEVLRFCHDVGVKRQVFKVWMHNNKQASKKKQES